MKYDDLLNAPYKHGGRDKNGFDCYGLVIECCRRNGQTLKDPLRDLDCLNEKLVNDYINKGINVKKIDAPKIGCIVEMEFQGFAHVGFLVSRNTVIHATTDKGVRTTALGALKVLAYYEVENENNDI